jgi:Uma2 family endonuclease
MATLPTYYLSPDEYLAIERKAQRKSEYIDGAMYAMAGASEPHNLIVGNILTELKHPTQAVDCKVYPSDLKVQMLVEDYVRQGDGHGLYTRLGGPDAAVFLPAISCEVRLLDIYRKIS